MTILISVVASAILTSAFWYIFYRVLTPKVGTWTINEADPNKDIFSIQFTQDPEIIYHSKQICLEVIREKVSAHNR